MKLIGKKIAFLGDSITEGSGVKDRAANRYDNVLARLAGMELIHSDGIGGSRLAYQRTPSEEPRRDLCFCGCDQCRACFESQAQKCILRIA